MNLTLETIKKAIERGFIISLWKDRRGFNCEINKQTWPKINSHCTHKSPKKAIKLSWKGANSNEIQK